MTEDADLLDVLTEQLNDKLAEAEALFVARFQGVTGEVTLGEGDAATGAVLRFANKTSWGLFVCSPAGGDAPLLRTSRRLRVLAAFQLSALAQVLSGREKVFLKEIQDAIVSVNVFVAMVKP